MFLNKVNVRIALTFTLFSTIISTVVFSALLIMITGFLVKEDLHQLQYQLMSMDLKYSKGGFKEVISDIDISDMQYEGRPYFIRIQKGISIFDLGPTSWKKGFNYDLLNNKKRGEITKLSSSEFDFNLDVLTHITSDGTVMQTGVSDQYRNQFIRVLKKVFIILITPLIVVSFLFGLYYSSKTLKPVTDLTKTIKGIIKTGKKEPSLTKYGNNELSELITLFNTLFEKNENLIKGMKETLDNVSHDLRTPLTRIRGASEVALSSDDSKVLKEAHSDCIEEIDSITKMLNALLDITAAENGVLNLDIQEFDIKNLLIRTVDLYSFIAEEKMINITLNYYPEDSFFTGDEIKMRQVVANILDNAVKYSENGGVIEVNVDRDETELIISIRDCGIGISEEEIHNIWNRLYRSTRSRNEPGLGLGLSMVKAIVNAHGGKVHVDSDLGKGSTFTLNFPLQYSNRTVIE